ncbi:MAG: inorganic phosphate transporter [Thermoleophilia bacterium]
MSPDTVVLCLVVVTALAFDFTNGFHDTANAMATSIATGALRPRVAVALSSVLNIVGAFLSVEVALTVTNAVIKVQDKTGAPNANLLGHHGAGLLMILSAGLVGAILWNQATWLVGLPSSSSHALFGGMIGATIASLGMNGVKWQGDGTKLDGVMGKVVLPAIASPVIAAAIAMIGTWLVYRLTVGVDRRFRDRGFKWGQVGSASMLSLAHGANDAQKTMGIITLALIGSGHWTNLKAIPWWVKAVCALAIAMGTYMGGWRIIRTLGSRLVDIQPPQGLASDGAAGAVILVSSHLGFALSTTHVATGSILGSGLGRGTEVRWAVALRMVLAWITTLPAAGVAGFLVWHLGDVPGNTLAGAILMFALLATGSWTMWRHSRRDVVDHTNVNNDGSRTSGPPGGPADDVLIAH